MNKIAASLAFVAVALSGTASAAPISVLTPVDQAPYFNSQFGLIGSFSQTYNFSISTLSDTADTVTNHFSAIPFMGQTLTLLNIPDLNLSIYNSSNTLLSSSGTGVTVPGFNVSSGSYYAVVSGTGTGIAGGAYTLSLFAIPHPVPVPAAAWLLGSGLIGLVGVARRKEQA